MSLINPYVAIHISKTIAMRTKKQLETMYKNSETSDSSQLMLSLPKTNSKLKTIGILPTNNEILVCDFARRLRDSFHGIGESALLLNNSKIVSKLGKHVFTRFGKLKLNTWLVEQEEKVNFVIYVADSGVNSLWTQKCIRQSDCILLIANAEGDPSITEFERLLIAIKTTARKELVLLHKSRYCKSGLTSSWLKNRTWVQAHHHVHYDSLNRDESSQTILYKNTLDHIKDRLKNYLTYKIYERQSRVYLGNRSDFSRLSRRLSGKSIGIVLGGGGARGIGHIGFIRALEEAGVPIDIVGGTSIGAFIGGLFAKDSDTVAIYGRAKMFSSRMSTKWRLIMDLTYPVISWFSGHQFNRAIWKSFSDTKIEDLWLPYFCVTTNITHSRMDVHLTGYLWRYVRASMGLSGFLPPLCDNGNLLVDGGYVNFLPVDIMKSMGINTIFAIDVSGKNDIEPVYYGDTVSGTWVALNRWNPLSSYSKIPTLDEIQSRLMFVSGVKQLKKAKITSGCHYVRLPIDDFKTMDFGKFEKYIKLVIKKE